MKEIKVPALRFGTEYQSLERHSVVDLGTGETLATLGLTLENQIATDCGHRGLLDRAFAILQKIPAQQRVTMCETAGNYFEFERLPCGNVWHGPDQYTDVVARTSGLSHALVRGNTTRIATALRNTHSVFKGLSRNMPYEAFNQGFAHQDGSIPVRLIPRAKALGACMPNNSPGVHVVWLASIAFGIPVLIRPGSSEPFTPYRLIQAFIKAGFPAEVFGYYPCDYVAANRIPSLAGAGIVFGSDATVKQWAHNPRVQVHGSGYSKLIIGEDRINAWWGDLEALAQNVSANSGRSCFTVSTMIVPRYGQAIAGALAEKLTALQPGPLDDPSVTLSAMAMPEQARKINERIDELLKGGGATNMSARHQPNGRLVTYEGRTYLLPTVILCDSMDHPLAREEFLFPYVAVVEASNADAMANLGPTLSLALYTDDEGLIDQAVRSDVSLVSVNAPTSQLDRMQPHEENLFELLYERKSLVRPTGQG